MASPFQGVDALTAQILPRGGKGGKEREGREGKGRGWEAKVGALIHSKVDAIF